MIHPTATVAEAAEIDPTAEIGPWCTIGPEVKIGPRTRLISHVVIDGWAEIGAANTIHPFAVIGGIPQDLKYEGELTRVVIGDRNTIREGVTINLGTVQGGGKTAVGDQNLLMAYAHVAHDCRVGSCCVLANSVALAGHVTVEDHVTIGGLVGVKQYVRIGAHAFIGGLSGVEQDVPPFTIVIGLRPAAIRGVNIVGLKRRGFDNETISRLRDAVKLWTRPQVRREQCLLDIELQLGGVPEVREFVAFVRGADTVVR